MDKNAFFREITLRICSHLNIEEGLHSCIQFLSEHMPADRLYLQRYEPDLGAMRLVVRADADGGELMDQLVPLNQQALNSLKGLGQEWRAGQLPAVIVVNRSAEEPVTRRMLDALHLPPSSAMSLPLNLEGKIIGTLALLAEGDDRFEPRHAELYALLKEPFFIAMSNTLKHREILELKDLLADDNRYLHRELRRLTGDEIVGGHFGLRNVMQSVQQVAALDSPVLLQGETGVGKDVIANAIHASSPRSGGPFISVNCGAIPDTLVDSELFGHEKGAFTGAITQKRGRFERAEGGTIFLDEIGELPLAAQSRLLRVLQSKEIERVGGSNTLTLDIRIIAATNRDLEQMVRNKEFREDLWYRLNVFPISIPPLRERTEDLAELLQHFIHRKVKELKLSAIPPLATAAMERLQAYSWPGNVRELQNVVERELILHPHGPLTFDGIARESPSRTPSLTPPVTPASDNLNHMITLHIEAVLEKTQGKIHGPEGAAELLGINASTLRNRMNALGIQYLKRRRTPE